MEMLPEDIITTSLQEFCRISGISRSRAYELFASGELDSITIGKRRLVIIESYRRLIERNRVAGQKISPAR